MPSWGDLGDDAAIPPAVALSWSVRHASFLISRPILRQQSSPGQGIAAVGSRPRVIRVTAQQLPACEAFFGSHGRGMIAAPGRGQ